MSQKTWWVVVATLILVCGFLGFQLMDRNDTIGSLNTNNAELTMAKDQLVLDLEKMRFSYDTLETENSMMVAELAAQQERIEGLLTKVKNGYWELGRAKKEAETLRNIMKGYIVTIDSLNQLNTALLDENLAMKEQVEVVSQENADLVQRQENMEEMLKAGRTLQIAELNPTGIRILSSGRQRDTDRATRTEMFRVCFTILENRIAPVGNTTLSLRITDSSGNVLPNQDGELDFSANRTIDYARERLDACIFYDSAAEGMSFPKGTYVVDILQGEVVLGTSDLVLR